MGRVHGDHKIKRKTSLRKRNSYSGYRLDLKEDFCNICGYCGKNFTIITSEIQIDHIVPKSLYPSLANEYSNLVYSCRVCNRNKSNDWPLNRYDIHNDGEKGYIDPASDEYDCALERNDKGAIIYKNKVGKYMYEHFKFGIRPLDTCWLIEQIQNKKEQIESKIEAKKQNNETDAELNELLSLFYQVQQKFDVAFKELKAANERI